MKKIILGLFFSLILTNCASSNKASQTVKFSYSENFDTTYIENLYQIDTIKVAGKWEEIIIKNSKPSHAITISNNEVLLDFIPYPIEKRNKNNQIISNPQLLKSFLENRTYTWNYLNLKHSILKSDKISYYVVEVDKKISLLGIKGNNSFYLTYIRTQNKDIAKEANYLIDFFQNKIISENQK